MTRLKKNTNKNCALIFSITFVRNIYHSKQKWARYHTYTLAFMLSIRYSCQILMKLGFA